MPEQNKPETYLTPQERQEQSRLFGAVEEFPQKFIAWLDDHLRVNVPRFPITQIQGFNTYQQMIEQFMNFLQDQNWEFIDAKGDLIVGVANDLFTVLPVTGTGYVLTSNPAAGAGMYWANPASSGGNVGSGAEIIFTNPSVTSVTGSYYGFVVPEAFGGLNLVGAHGFVFTESSSGAPTFQIRNVTQGANMLSTAITIDSGEFTSYSAATPPVIDTGNDDVATGDRLRFDLTVAGTGAMGHGAILTFG